MIYQRLIFSNKWNILGILILTIIFSNMIGLVFFLPSFQLEITEKVYQEVEQPDLIAELRFFQIGSGENNSFLVEDTKIWNDIFQRTFSFPNEFDEIDKTRSYIDFIIDVHSSSLYRDINRTILVGTNSLENGNQTTFFNPDTHFVIMQDSQFLKLAERFADDQNQSDSINYIYAYNSDSPRYLNFNNSLNIMGSNNSQLSVTVDRIWNPRFPEQQSISTIPPSFYEFIPTRVLKDTDTSAIITSHETFWSLINSFPSKILPVSQINIEIHIWLNLNDYFSLSSIIKPNSGISDELESLISIHFSSLDLVRIHDDIELSSSNLIYKKFGDIEQTDSIITFLSYIMWIIAVVISGNVFRLNLSKISKNSNWRNFEDYLFNLGFKLEDIIIYRWKVISIWVVFGSFIGWLSLHVLSLGEFSLNPLLIILCTVIPITILFLHDIFEIKNHSLFKVDFDSSQSRSDSTSNNYLLIVGIFFIVSLILLHYSPTLLSGVDKNLPENLTFQIVRQILLLIFALGSGTIFLIYFKQFFLFVIDNIEKIFPLFKAKKFYPYFIRSIKRNLNFIRQIDFNLALILVVLFFNIFLVQFQSTAIMNEENMAIGADLEITEDFFSFQQLNVKRDKIMETILSENIHISPFLNILAETALLKNSQIYGFSLLEILALDFSYLEDFQSYSSFAFDYDFNQNFSNKMSLLISYALESNWFPEESSYEKEISIITPSLATDFANIKTDNNSVANIVGTYSFAPRITNTPTNLETTAVINFESLFRLILDDIFIPTIIRQQGFLLWFPESSPNDILKVAESLENAGFSVKTSPHISGILSGKFSSQVIGLTFFADFTSIFFFFLFAMIFYFKISDFLKALSINYETLIYNNFAQHSIKIGLIIIFVIYITSLIFLSLIVSFCFAYATNLILNFFFSITNRYVLTFLIITPEIVYTTLIIFITAILIIGSYIYRLTTIPIQNKYLNFDSVEEK